MSYTNQIHKKEIYIDISVFRNITDWLIIIFTTLIACIFIILCNNLFYNVIGFVFFIFGCLFSVRCEIHHPYTWFLPIFMLYSISSPILVQLGALPYLYTYHFAIVLHFLAILVFVFIVTPNRYNYQFNLYKQVVRNTTSIFFIFMFFLFLSFIYLSFFFIENIKSKYTRALMNNPLAFLGFSFHVLVTLFSIYIVQLYVIKREFPKSSLLYLISYFFVAFAITGERHVLFTFLIVLFFLYFTLFQYKKMLGKLVFIASIFLSLPINALLQQMKMILLTKHFSIDINKFWVEMIYSEFKSSTRNVAILLEYCRHKFFYGLSLLMDLKRAIIPGFLFPHTESTTIWFNKTFFTKFYSMGGGVGFSLVGTGYINFGVCGVIILFIFLGLLCKFLYKKSTVSSLWFIIYINLIPIILFSIRGDTSVIISQSIKHVIIPIIAVIIFSDIFYTIYIKNNRKLYNKYK